MDCSPPGSSVHGIFQARILEWVIISFSRRSSPPRDQTWISCLAGSLLHFRRILYCWATWEACVAHLLTCYFNQHFLNTSYVLGVIVILSLSHVRLFVTSWTAARQASLSPTPRAYSNSCPSSSDAIQPSHPMLSLSPPAFNLFQHQGLFKLVSSRQQVAKGLELQL